MRNRFLLLCLGCCLGYNPTDAQLFVRKKANEDEKPPAIILVQLNANQRKKEAFARSKDKSLLRQINIDTDSIISKMTADFNDNFYYCPVYYFIDTNADLVREQKFQGVLLDKDLQPAKSIAFKPTLNYFIVSYGVPIAKPVQHDPTKKNDLFDTDYTNASGKMRLIVMDKTMTMLEQPLPDGSDIKRQSTKRPRSFYKYESPKYKLYYRPSAAGFSAQLNSFYGPYPFR